MAEPKPSVDKRSVATDATATLGTIIGPASRRDAIHVAVEPVVAAHDLNPGDHVGFVGDRNHPNQVGKSSNPVGIIDPYLNVSVRTGQMAWLLVYPRQITSLRHVWSHPAFRDESELVEKKVEVVEQPSESEEWIRSYATGIGVDYQELISHAHEYVDNGDHWNEGSRFESEWIPDEFWDHFENVTGRKVIEDKRGSFFSCSC